MKYIGICIIGDGRKKGDRQYPNNPTSVKIAAYSAGENQRQYFYKSLGYYLQLSQYIEKI